MSKALVGKTITAFTLDHHNTQITVHTEDGSVSAATYGDCCSHTWIENIELPSRGFPALVQSVGDINMPDLGDMPGEDVVAYYGYKIVTNNGDIIIDYRNSSNGYYGGSLDWSDFVNKVVK